MKEATRFMLIKNTLAMIQNSILKVACHSSDCFYYQITWNGQVIPIPIFDASDLQSARLLTKDFPFLSVQELGLLFFCLWAGYYYYYCINGA